MGGPEYTAWVRYRTWDDPVLNALERQDRADHLRMFLRMRRALAESGMRSAGVRAWTNTDHGGSVTRHECILTCPATGAQVRMQSEYEVFEPSSDGLGEWVRGVCLEPMNKMGALRVPVELRRWVYTMTQLLRMAD